MWTRTPTLNSISENPRVDGDIMNDRAVDRQSKLMEVLLSCATLLPEFDEVAAMYERDPERDASAPLKEQADHVARMALILHGIRERAKRMPSTIEALMFGEASGMPMRERLFARRYNTLLAKLWAEHVALHPERSARTNTECQDVAIMALRLTHATQSTAHAARGRRAG